MQIQNIPFNVSVDPLSFVADIRILSGNNTQVYDRDSGSFTDDRTLVPLLILPWASVHDPNNIMASGDVVLTGVEYYSGVPSLATLITNNADFIIGDTGCPEYSLKIKKNVDVNSPMEIYARFMFTDTRTNATVTVERSIPVRTTYYEESIYSLKTNQPSGFTIDPIRFPENEAGRRAVQLTTQLYSGKEEVADSNAVYFYYVLDNNNFRPVGEEDLWLLTPAVNGYLPKTIEVDANLFNKLTIKVRAAYYAAGESKPTEPVMDNIQTTTTINVALPATAQGKMVVHKGQYIAPGVNQELECECVISDNGGIIENPEMYYMCFWYAKEHTTGASEVQIGYGFNLQTTSEAVGITNNKGVSIYPIVFELGCYAILTDNAGRWLVDNNNNALVARTIK